MASDLLCRLEEEGYRGRVVPVEHLRDLQEEIEERHRQGFFDEEFYQECLTGFRFSPPDDLPEARSLIVVAIPQPQIRFTFMWNGEAIPLVVPPIYLHWRETDQQVEDALAEMLKPEGYRVAQANLPKKLLAVQSGLAVYGKNNVTYVAGLGSFHRLVPSTPTFCASRTSGASWRCWSAARVAWPACAPAPPAPSRQSAS
jgi:epoxyqueuosine reductase